MQRIVPIPSESSLYYIGIGRDQQIIFSPLFNEFEMYRTLMYSTLNTSLGMVLFFFYVATRSVFSCSQTQSQSLLLYVNCDAG